MDMEQQVDSICRDFQRRNINVPQTWIEQCVQFLVQDEEIQQVLQQANSRDRINELVYEQYLLCDLSSLDHPYLQTYYNNNNNITQLVQDCVVQVNYCVDISQSYYSQLKMITCVDDGNAAVDVNDDPQNKWTPKPAKGCMLEITDGINAMKAYESEPIDLLQQPLLPGCKVLLRSPITISEGCLLLNKNSLVLLGGHVEELAQTFEPASLLKHLIDEKKLRHQQQIERNKTFSDSGKLSSGQEKITPRSESTYNSSKNKTENKTSDGLEDWDDWDDDSFTDELLLPTNAAQQTSSTAQPIRSSEQRKSLSSIIAPKPQLSTGKREPDNNSTIQPKIKQLKQTANHSYAQQSNSTLRSDNSFKTSTRQTGAITSNNSSHDGFRILQPQKSAETSLSHDTFKSSFNPTSNQTKPDLSMQKNEPQDAWSDVEMDFDDDFEEEMKQVEQKFAPTHTSNKVSPQTLNSKNTTPLSNKTRNQNCSNLTNSAQRASTNSSNRETDNMTKSGFTSKTFSLNASSGPSHTYTELAGNAAVKRETKRKCADDEEIVNLLSSDDEFEQMNTEVISGIKPEIVKPSDKSKSVIPDTLPECSKEHQAMFSFISTAKHLPDNATFTVKAHVSTALSKIEIKDRQYWNVRVRINDGTGYLDCDIHHQIIEKYLGPCTKQIKKDPIAKQKFIQNAELFQEYLSKLNSMLSIEKKSPSSFLIYGVNTITKTHIKQFTDCLST